MYLRSILKPLKYFIIIIFLVAACPGYAQIIPKMEFNNAEIIDILMALSSATGKSIIPDDTIKGTATYYFAEMEFEKAFDIFLTTYKMYYQEVDSVYYVSRIRVAYNAEKNTISMDAEDVDIRYLIDAASKAINKTIHYDPLPATNLTIHAQDMSPDSFLPMLLVRFPDYLVETEENYYYIRRQKPDTGDRTGTYPAAGVITRNGDLYSLNVKKVLFNDLIIKLFNEAGYEYSLLSRSSKMLEDMHFNNKTFDQILRLILEQMSMDYRKIGEIYYLFKISERDILKKFSQTIIIPLRYISIKEFKNLIPQELYAGNLIKFDENTNSIILTGSIEQIGPIEAFIKQIDQDSANLNYYRYSLNYITMNDFKTLFTQSEFKYDFFIIVPNTNDFVMRISPQRKESFDNFMRIIDKKSEAYFIELKYIKAEDLLKKLPPSVVKEDLLETGDNSSIFFIGSPEKLAIFQRELEMIDRPIPQIQYKLLVVQFNRGNAQSWNARHSVSKELSPTTDNVFEIKDITGSGELGSLFNLSFDIVATFGMQFSENLHYDLSTNKAQIFADTTLNAISGQDVEFRNTQTSRYEVKATDADTGETEVTPVTSEITSGLIIKINGWVSGSDMITMNVNATVSKQTSGEGEGKLPTTYEKVVSTQVRTESGKPIVISGLISQEVDQKISKIPILGDIPLLGLLFSSTTDQVDNTEMVIYIIPHVTYQLTTEEGISYNLERLYNKYIEPLHNLR